MSKIAVIIPAINLWSKYSRQCIQSIKSKNHELRILFIDNGSTDETLIEAGKLVSNTFAHKRNEERWGVSQSWNFGILDAWSRGFDYCLVLNNDILLHEDCIDRLVERFEKGDVGIVTAMDIQGECMLPTMIFDKHSKDYESVSEAEHPHFSAYMISKACWDTVGEFDEGFSPAYYEDNDYVQRMRIANIKAIVYPPALFYHYGSRTQNEALDKPIVDSSKTHRYFISKWGGNPDSPGLYKWPLNNQVNTIKSVKQNNYENK